MTKDDGYFGNLLGMLWQGRRIIKWTEWTQGGKGKLASEKPRHSDQTQNAPTKKGLQSF